MREGFIYALGTLQGAVVVAILALVLVPISASVGPVDFYFSPENTETQVSILREEYLNIKDFQEEHHGVEIGFCVYGIKQGEEYLVKSVDGLTKGTEHSIEHSCQTYKSGMIFLGFGHSHLPALGFIAQTKPSIPKDYMSWEELFMFIYSDGELVAYHKDRPTNPIEVRTV